MATEMNRDKIYKEEMDADGNQDGNRSRERMNSGEHLASRIPRSKAGERLRRLSQEVYSSCLPERLDASELSTKSSTYVSNGYHDDMDAYLKEDDAQAAASAPSMEFPASHRQDKDTFREDKLPWQEEWSGEYARQKEEFVGQEREDRYADTLFQEIDSLIHDSGPDRVEPQTSTLDEEVYEELHKLQERMNSLEEDAKYRQIDVDMTEQRCVTEATEAANKHMRLSTRMEILEEKMKSMEEYMRKVERIGMTRRSELHFESTHPWRQTILKSVVVILLAYVVAFLLQLPLEESLTMV